MNHNRFVVYGFFYTELDGKRNLVYVGKNIEPRSRFFQLLRVCFVQFSILHFINFSFLITLVLVHYIHSTGNVSIM
jgi:hypothetical protein